MAEIQFRKYTAEDASTFKTLNVEWLEMYFEVEPIDERVLSNPQTEILDPGGFIVMAELEGKTVGIIGYGNTGKSFAKKLFGFEVEVICYDIKAGVGDQNAKQVSLEELQDRAQVISLHIPQTTETNGMIDKNFIDRVKNPFWFLNSARGKAVRTTDLVEGLRSKKILGAEMALECMRCQFKDCKSMGDTKNYCFAIDDHQGKDLPGYSPCTNCKRENDAALLDKLFLKVYYDINNALTLDREACEKLLVELYDKAKHWLHPSHWLLYKLSDCLQFVSKELAIQTRNNRFSIHGAHIQIHKQHALLLLNGIHVFHENENLTCVIKERAANALRTYVDKFYVKLKEEDELLKYQIQMKNKLLDKANELEREAISVQRNIRGLL